MKCRDLEAIKPKVKSKKSKIGKSRFFYFCLFTFAFLLSCCSSKPTDLRTLVPAETLVYLETNDLAAALQPIVDNEVFELVAKSKPDFSALKGVQIAVAVTGFETTEEKLTDETSVGRVQPRFVAVADTHAWNYQAVAFAEQKLGNFVTSIYKSDADEEITDKHGGKYFTWTAKDGRKAFALVIGSLIYFGNDETAIEKCLAVRRGETDSILKTGKVSPAAPETLASGYVSTDGIAQIASIIGLKFAADASDDADVQSAVAGILPQLLRNSVTEISWKAMKTENGIEDKYIVSMPSEIAKIFDETMAAGDRVNPSLIAQLPETLSDATLYNLRDFQLSFRSVLLAAQQQTNPLAGKIIAASSVLFFEPYGIVDPELFLGSIGNDPAGRNIVTARLDAEGDDPVIIATTGNLSEVLKSAVPELKPPKDIIEGDVNIWSTPDESLQIIFQVSSMKIGSKASLALCRAERIVETNDIRSDSLRKLAISKAPFTTISQDNQLTAQIVGLISDKRSDDIKATSNYYTETRFTRTGIERRTVSDFGLIGSIIAQLGGE